jgi:hypothetical protein
MQTGLIGGLFADGGVHDWRTKRQKIRSPHPELAGNGAKS